MKLKNIFLAVALACLVACSGCAHNGWGGGDPDATRIQHLMKATVKVSVDLMVQFPADKDEEPEVEDAGWVGSGYVVGYDPRRDESLVMTASHVCHMPDKVAVPIMPMFGIIIQLPVVKKSMSVMTVEGETLKADVLYENTETDSCVIRTFGYAGETVRLADKKPPLGAKIENAAAPLGVFAKHMVLVNEGRYAGEVSGAIFGDDPTRRFMIASSATIGGESGSALYYKGEVVGMLVAGPNRYEHICIAVTLDDLQDTYAEGYKVWRERQRK